MRKKFVQIIFLYGESFFFWCSMIRSEINRVTQLWSGKSVRPNDSVPSSPNLLGFGGLSHIIYHPGGIFGIIRLKCSVVFQLCSDAACAGHRAAGSPAAKYPTGAFSKPFSLDTTPASARRTRAHGGQALARACAQGAALYAWSVLLSFCTVYNLCMGCRTDPGFVGWGSRGGGEGEGWVGLEHRRV